jgi:hypothetical protein
LSWEAGSLTTWTVVVVSCDGQRHTSAGRGGWIYLYFCDGWCGFVDPRDGKKDLRRIKDHIKDFQRFTDISSIGFGEASSHNVNTGNDRES